MSIIYGTHIPLKTNPKSGNLSIWSQKRRIREKYTNLVSRSALTDISESVNEILYLKIEKYITTRFRKISSRLQVFTIARANTAEYL